MKTTLSPAAKDHPTSASHSEAISAPQKTPAVSGGHLAHLASFIQRSSMVQAQAKAGQDINDSPRVQSLMALKAQMNQSAAFAPGPVEGPGGHTAQAKKLTVEEQPPQRKAQAAEEHSPAKDNIPEEQRVPLQSHITQRKQGRVRPAMQRKSRVPVNDDPSLEKEADVMGVKALQPRMANVQVAQPPSMASGAIAQFKWLATGKDLRWDKILGGLEWHYSRDNDAFWFYIVDDDAVPYDQWQQIEALESRLLTERELDELGFQEIEVEEGENRVEYAPPQPEFELPDESMVTMMGERELVESLTKHLYSQTSTRNYDRLIYINAFIRFKELNPELSVDEALARFEVHSSELVSCQSGGHCGALSGDLLGTGDYGPGAYLVASRLPSDYQQEGAPEYCHVAAMIRFQHPETAQDNGLVLLEPGFNITQPIVVKRGRITSIPMEQEIWDFSINEECTEIVCQPRPKDESVRWPQKKRNAKRMTYRTDVFLNPDMSLTVPLLRVDGRPQILARDEKGEVIAVIAINYKKKAIEFRIGKDKFKPVPFGEVDPEGKWLGGALEPLSKLLHMAPEVLIRRIYDAVTKHEPAKL